MPPRTPTAILAGTVAAMMIFGLMENLVRQPGSALPPDAEPIDETWVAAHLPEAPPPERRRPPPQRPATPARPAAPDLALLTTDDPTERADSRIVIPFAPEPPRLRPDGDLVGDPRGRPTGRDDGCRDGAPVARVMIAPEYPRAQRVAGVEGEVEVELSIGADGRVGAVRVVRASPRGAFDAATLRAVKRWSFQPQGAGCDQGAVTVREVVRYRLEGVEE